MTASRIERGVDDFIGQALVRTLAVVVGDELVQNVLKVTASAYDEMIETAGVFQS